MLGKLALKEPDEYVYFFHARRAYIVFPIGNKLNNQLIHR